MKWRLPLAGVSGVVGALAFPPVGWWPLAFVSLAGLSLLSRGLRSRSSALVGLVFGAGLFLPMLHWTATYVGSAPWLILVFSQTWFTALLGAALPLLARLPLAPLWTAAGWVAEEAARDRSPFGGFPWGRWAFSQSESPLRPFIAVGGAPLLTFAVALVGALLACGIAAGYDALGPARRPDSGGRALLRARGVTLAVSALTSAGVLLVVGAALAGPVAPGGPSRTVTIAAIQGDVPDRGLEFNARRRQVLDNHVAETMALVAAVRAGRTPKPDLVLWPENASDIDPTTNADAAAEIQSAADAVGVPILVGALLDGPGPKHVTNVGIVWMPDSAPQPGPGQRYVKRHPVPFGEYIPLRSVARAVTNKVDLVARDMVAGKGNGLLTQTPVPLGDVICFEVAYDALVRSSVAAGARMLVVQTNNATFGHSGETYQQLAMTRLRAVEHGRAIVQVATSGKSAIIGPDGRTLTESGALFTPAVLVSAVPLETSTTLATRVGPWPEWVLTAAAALGALLAAAPWNRMNLRGARARRADRPAGGRVPGGRDDAIEEQPTEMGTR